MARKVLGVGSAQAVSADSIKVKSATLVGGAAADATATISGAAGGDEVIYLAAKAGTTEQFILPGAQEYSVNLSGAVTATVAGTGAQLMIDF